MAQKMFAQNEEFLSRAAAEDLTAFKFVKINSTDSAEVDVADTQGEQVLGVATGSFEEDAIARIAYRGITYVMAGAAVAVDDYVCTDSSGRAIKAGGTAAADFVAGRAMSPASAAADLIAVDLLPGGGASIADVGAGHKFFVIPIAVVAATTENDTGYDLPAKAIVKKVWMNMTTAPTAGTTKLIDVGTDGSGSNDPDGFLDGVSIASLGLAQGTLISSGQTLGLLLHVDEDGAGALVPEEDITSGGESITYSYSANDIAGQAGSIVIEFVEVE